MAVDNLALFLIAMRSGIPLLVLGIAEQATARHRRQIINSTSTSRLARLPRLVALHVRTTRTLSACAAATFGTLGILFAVLVGQMIVFVAFRFRDTVADIPERILGDLNPAVYVFVKWCMYISILFWVGFIFYEGAGLLASQPVDATFYAPSWAL